MRSGFITQSVRNYSERYKYEISANIPQGLNCYVFGAILGDTPDGKSYRPLTGYVISQTTSDDLDAVHRVR